MKRVLMTALASTVFLGCAPTHTLKEVVNDPSLIMPQIEPGDSANNHYSDSPLGKADQWVRDHLW